jgi:3-oxoacyl-[acyl-carrier-protein] synthase-1
VQPLYLRRITLTSSIGIGLAATLAALLTPLSLAPCSFRRHSLAPSSARSRNAALAPVREDLSGFGAATTASSACAATGQLRRGGRADAPPLQAGACGRVRGDQYLGILETELAYRRTNRTRRCRPISLRGPPQHLRAGGIRTGLAGSAGPAVVVSTACSSSAKVFAAAARAIAAGLCDAAVVGGVDSLCLTTLYGFHSLGLVSSAPCRPFDVDRAGISIGEGAGFALLVPEGDAADVRLLGAGESADAYHMSTPHPEGLGARLAMERAPSAPAWNPVQSTTSTCTARPRGPTTSPKRAPCAACSARARRAARRRDGRTCAGASGVVEAAICWLALAHGFLPGSCHTQVKDPALDVNYLLRAAARPQRIMSNSFGFGGTNCSIVLGRAG